MLFGFKSGYQEVLGDKWQSVPGMGELYCSSGGFPKFQPQTAIVRLLTSQSSQLLTRLSECVGCSFFAPCGNEIHNNTIGLFNTTSATEFIVKRGNTVVCEKTFAFEHHGQYSLNLDDCVVSTEIAPESPVPAVALLCVATLILLTMEGIPNAIRRLSSRGFVRAEQTESSATDSTTTGDTTTEQVTTPPPPTRKRYDSVDVFRGFLLVLMTFVNFGGGGIEQFEHAPWNGVTVADFVFPAFMQLVGVSFAFSTRKLCMQTLMKQSKRLVGLIVIGIFVINTGRDWTNLRFLGVLQRIALANFLFFLIHSICQSRKRDNEQRNTSYWNYCGLHFYFVLALNIIWYSVTLLSHASGCPRGYLGPGGLSDNSSHTECTGGIYRTIDNILGENHLYRQATCQLVYQCPVAFDPENLLGTLPSVINVFAGFQIAFGVVYLNGRNRILSLVFHTVAYTVAGLLLHYFTYPVNKNLWTPSFALITSAGGTFGLTIFVFLVDECKWLMPALKYTGERSLIAFMAQAIGRHGLPMNIEVDDPLKLSETARCVYACAVLLIFTYICHKKNINFIL